MKIREKNYIENFKIKKIEKCHNKGLKIAGRQTNSLFFKTLGDKDTFSYPKQQHRSKKDRDMGL